MIDSKLWFNDLFSWLPDSPLAAHEEILKSSIGHVLEEKLHGDMPRWHAALNSLPDIDVSTVSLNQSALHLHSTSPLSPEKKHQLYTSLKGLSPWRKGPFNFFGETIDTEWRSDWKWDRIAPHLSPLNGRLVLDVGCGSGYHCWRMLGAGARRIIGIDPSKLFMLQLQAFKRYAGQHLPVDLLPLKMEEFPQKTKAFDTVFSMGVLYHRKSPLEHLEELFHSLRPGGEMVLETLVVDGDKHTVLVPEDRYAMMRNVWFLPSTDHLLLWLKRLGFKHARAVDMNQTSTAEQRSTEWMQYQSLTDFLCPKDHRKTIEGHPAPLRTAIIAQRPF